VARRVARLTLDTLADLPESARSCLQWELDPVSRHRLPDRESAVAEKEAWVSQVLLEWGSCGRVVYVDDRPAGFVTYAPPAYLEGTASMPTAPVSDDAVQLAAAEVFPEHTGAGLGRLLMQEMVKDLVQRGGIRAVEAFGSTGAPSSRLTGDHPCLLPVEFLQRVGFKTQRPHPRSPRMRLELKSVVTWREEVEAALERLLGVVRPSRAPRPVVGRDATVGRDVRRDLRRGRQPGVTPPAGQPM
jgi:GNAT superfamily N-acetyltransferase